MPTDTLDDMDGRVAMPAGHKPATQSLYNPIIIGQIVILLDDNDKFINCWHTTNLITTKPGTLDIWKK
jgi:hypothetical protein